MTAEQSPEKGAVLEVVTGSVPGFIGPLDEVDDFDGRCPVCGLDPYDPTCHHPACPTICSRPLLDADHRLTHRCPQTDPDMAERFARIWGITAPLGLPTPPIPNAWKVSERLAAWDQGRRAAEWATRDSHIRPASTDGEDRG